MEAWGTTFNELDWDALLMLTRDEQEEIMYNLFAPQGDLKFTRGRISMNCNDYGRSWYSCDEVQGDLELRYFNIERDKRSIIFDSCCTEVQFGSHLLGFSLESAKLDENKQ